MTKTVLFLCPHNAAKSVLAAAYFQTLADEHGLHLQADTAGTDPDDAVWPSVVELLAADGLDVIPTEPRHVTAKDLERAYRVISLGCDVGSLTTPETQIEDWDDVPMASEDLMASRDAIRAHVETLVAELRELE